MTASFADNEIWHVLMDGNDMKRLNVEQLDDAFRLSLVDASTMVWKAGMKQWQRLGAVAGIEEEREESITRAVMRSAPPPPPRPMARPAPRPPSRAPAAPASFHTAVTPVFQMDMLVAPVFAPTLHAPDPYVLPKRRVSIPSEVDFRRASGGVRWGRWLVALLLVSGGVLGAYRQNLLREGARKLGVETKYLASEHRATAFVTAKAPTSLKNVLTRLALLPGPNAVAAAITPPQLAPTPAPAAAAVAPPTVEAARPSTTPSNEPEMKTVSLDSLPVLAADAPAAKAPAAAAPAVAPTPRARPAAVAVTAKAEPKPARESVRESTKVAKVEKPEPVEKAEPKAKAAPPPPPAANDSFLKAAIRSAIAADNAKSK